MSLFTHTLVESKLGLNFTRSINKWIINNLYFKWIINNLKFIYLYIYIFFYINNSISL